MAADYEVTVGYFKQPTFLSFAELSTLTYFCIIHWNTSVYFKLYWIGIFSTLLKTLLRILSHFRSRISFLG